MMKRRLSFAFVLFACAPLVAHASDPLVVKTDKGTLRGALDAGGKVRAFKGIPFAAPPVGNLRWQPPQPAAEWTGVHDATQYGKHCMQVENVFHTFSDTGMSEDCLSLNVWTPADAKNRKLPVMVWIYGGGFRAGGAAETRQTGEILAQHGVIVVSMNYRLGIFGFFVHPGLVEESAHHAAGNYGLLDQVAALDWVQKNIAKFGGDPKNVTIFGQSAGSVAVSLLMASPVAQGKFARAIGESGGAFSNGQDADDRGKREEADVKFAQGAFGSSKLEDLRALSAEDLQNKTTEYSKDLKSGKSFGPDVDGWFLPAPVPQIYAEGKQAHVPLMAGWTADEQRSAVITAKTQPTMASFKEKAQAEFGDNTAEFLKLYPASTDAEAVRSEGDLASDHFIIYSTWRWLEEQVKTGGAPVYRYRFDLGGPGDKLHPKAYGAFHSDDIDYVFGQLDTREGATWRPEDRRLSAEMMNYWTNFARTGNPNGAGLPNWPAYNAADNWEVMHLDANSAAKPDDQRARYLFLDKAWAKSETRPARPSRTAGSAPTPE